MDTVYCPFTPQFGPLILWIGLCTIHIAMVPVLLK